MKPPAPCSGSPDSLCESAAPCAGSPDSGSESVSSPLLDVDVELKLLANVLLRDLARSGRLARIRIRLQDRPGALYKVMREFDEHNVNIIEIYHQRIFTSLPAKGLITDIECEARDRKQLDALITSLRDKGYVVETVELG